MNARERTDLSKTLSKILRHKAADEGLTLRPDGFIDIDSLIARPKLVKLGCTLERVQEVVDKDAKTRFTLRLEEGDGKWWIRANQGHSLDVQDLELVQLTAESMPSEVIHGTFKSNLPSIQVSGLSRMKRNHIHLATGLPGSPGVASGIRGSCDVFIYIDAQLALADGITFFKSINGVILTAGVDGTLPPRYFAKVVEKGTLSLPSVPSTNSSETPPAQGKIKISQCGDRYLIFDVAALKILREEWRICGVLVGTLPQISQQNTFLGLPLQLTPEETLLLVRRGAAVVIDDATVHRQTIAAVTDKELFEWKARIRRDQEQKDQTISKLQMEKRIKVMREKGLEHLLPSLSISSESARRNEDESVASPVSAHIFTSSPDILYNPTLQRDHLLPTVLESRYRVYEYLYDRGYFLTPGLRFGCQFVAYPGDPLRFHSHFLASGWDWTQRIPLMDIVGGGRLGTGVKKAWVCGGVDPCEGEVKCFTVEWAGM